MICFNQEERVAGLMSEVCPFLREMKRRDRGPLRSLVPQGPHRTPETHFENLLLLVGLRLFEKSC